MNVERDIQGLLERLERDARGELSPGEVDALVAVANARPERLAGVVPAGDAFARLAIETAAAPSASEWDAVWSGIERGASAARGAALERRLRVHPALRIWRPLAALAACVAFMLVWRLSPQAVAAPWELRLARDAEIVEVEVTGDAYASLDYSPERGDVTIWVFDESGA